jgi:hypothetical protein
VDPVGNVSFIGMLETVNTAIRNRWQQEFVKPRGEDSSERVNSAVLSVILDSESWCACPQSIPPDQIGINRRYLTSCNDGADISMRRYQEAAPAPHTLLALHNELPMNTFGGQIGAGRLHGFAHEPAAVQLRTHLHPSFQRF